MWAMRAQPQLVLSRGPLGDSERHNKEASQLRAGSCVSTHQILLVIGQRCGGTLDSPAPLASGRELQMFWEASLGMERRAPRAH